MPRKKLSQREAGRLLKRLAAYQEAFDGMYRLWAQEYQGGVEIMRMTTTESERCPIAVIGVARKLGHAVVVIDDDKVGLRFIALPLPTVKE